MLKYPGHRYKYWPLSAWAAIVLFVFTAGDYLIAQESTRSPAIAVSQESPHTDVISSAQVELVEAINAFGFKLFKQLEETTPDDSNVFISPVSAACALTIVLNGADGETREQIAECLKVEGIPLSHLNQEWQHLLEYLSVNDSLIEVTLANSLWVRKDKALHASFKNALLDYNCHLQYIDSHDDPDRKLMNSWIADATHGLIGGIADEGLTVVDPAVLINAAYLKGGWALPFDSAKTRPDVFYLSDGTTVDCDMMWLTGEDRVVESAGRNYRLSPSITGYFPPFYGYDEPTGAMTRTSGATLDYGYGGFRMTILVPFRDYEDTTSTFDTLMNELTLASWRATLPMFHPGEFDLGIPKFQFRYNIVLNETLRALGIESAFDSRWADFSNMFEDGVGWIDSIYHGTYLRVDETGTEAAAVTNFRFGDELHVPIYANRPFVVIIHEKNSGVILFIGKIANPVWQS